MGCRYNNLRGVRDHVAGSNRGKCSHFGAIWKKRSLHTPLFILLEGLAITDFLIGLIILPFFVANAVVELLNKVPPYYFILYGIFSHGISSYLGLNAIFVITLI